MLSKKLDLRVDCILSLMKLKFKVDYTNETTLGKH
jgi:hypothetical protein